MLEMQLCQRWWERRHYFIPPTIVITYVIMIVTCLYHSPEQYRENHIFQISNLGNWQEGVGFFSFFMAFIAVMMFFLVKEVYKKRMNRYHKISCTGDNEDKWCRHNVANVVWHISAFLLMIGIMITGSFQQSYNKPSHNIGLGVMIVSINAVLLGDILQFFFTNSCCCSWCSVPCFLSPRKNCQAYLALIRVLFLIMIVVSGLMFLAYNTVAKGKWDDAEEIELKRLNITCPKMNVATVKDSSLYRWPCKSKTLWDEEDPGWPEFKRSALCEIILFSVLVVYTITYIFELPKKFHGQIYDNVNEKGNGNLEEAAPGTPLVQKDKAPTEKSADE